MDSEKQHFPIHFWLIVKHYAKPVNYLFNLVQTNSSLVFWLLWRINGRSKKERGSLNDPARCQSFNSIIQHQQPLIAWLTETSAKLDFK